MFKNFQLYNPCFLYFKDKLTLKGNEKFIYQKNFSLHTKLLNMKLTSKSSENFKNVENTEISGSISCKREELDLGITLKGGQSFRWTAREDGNSFRGVFSNAVWTLAQTDDQLLYTMHASLNENLKCDEILSDYFRFNVSLKENLDKWADLDSHFKTSYDKIGAVRILNQDIVENLFCFICSSNNNIIRISGMVEKLCCIFGEKICKIEDKEYYNFPTIEALATPKVETTLRKEGFGYRARYIFKSAEKLLSLGGRDWLQKLHKENGSTYENARENLMSLPGIGPKVADCICLMSLGHLEAIPVDTHIFQVACANYTPHLSHQKTVTPKIHHEINTYLRDLWGPLAGWAQAIVFCVKINSADSRKNTKRSSNQNKKSSTRTKSRKKC